MSELDAYYKALVEFRKNIKDDKELQREALKIRKTDTSKDLLNSINYQVTIESDWISEIEKGLIFIGNAIKEDKQFILNDGEVVPIEKAKRVSKASVKHLAKHSNLISADQDPLDDIIPNKLYMEEKLTDYAVYENRFLYFLLVQLKEFIRVRYEAILAYSKTITTDFNASKVMKSPSRNFSIETKIHDERTDSDFINLDDDNLKLLERIRTIFGTVNTLLQTELMDSVSKAPMIKTPIVKTNTLKMNNNFKAAVALYDFITEYDKLGYKANERKKEFAPLTEDISTDFAYLEGFNTFLAYMHASENEKNLKKNYQEYLKEKAELEKEELSSKIKGMKRRVAADNLTLEEYVIYLERLNELLQADSDELKITRETVESLNLDVINLTNEKNELNKELDYQKQLVIYKDEAIQNWQDKYQTDMQNLKNQMDYEIESIRQMNEEKIRTLTDEHDKEIQDLTERHNSEFEEFYKERDQMIEEVSDAKDAEINRLKDDYDYRIDELELRLKDYDKDKEEEISKYEEQIQTLNDEVHTIRDTLETNTKERNEAVNFLDQKVAQAVKEQKIKDQGVINKYKADFSELTEKYNLLRAEYLGLREKNGMGIDIDDYTSKERFDELEKQYLAFYNLFNKAWKETKIKIRKDILGKKKKDKNENKDLKENNKLPKEETKKEDTKPLDKE